MDELDLAPISCSDELVDDFDEGDHEEEGMITFEMVSENESQEETEDMTNTDCYEFLHTEISIEEEESDQTLFANGWRGNTPEPSYRNEPNVVINGVQFIDETLLSPSFKLMQPINGVESTTKVHECEFCGLIVSCSRNVKRHIRRIHEGKNIFKCMVCKEDFKDGTALKKHRKNAHFPGELPYPPPPPPKLYSFASVVGSKEPKKCPYCPKSFKYTRDLGDHIKRHIGVKEYKCNSRGCGREFITRKEQRKHEIKVHKMVNPMFSNKSLPPIKKGTAVAPVTFASLQTSLTKKLNKNFPELTITAVNPVKGKKAGLRSHVASSPTRQLSSRGKVAIVAPVAPKNKVSVAVKKAVAPMKKPVAPVKSKAKKKKKKKKERDWK